MAIVDLVVNGESVDLGEKGDVSIVLFRVLFNFMNPTERGGDHSYTISIPESRTNNRIFKNIKEIDGIHKFSGLGVFRFTLEVNGISVLTGEVKISDAPYKKFNIRLLGDNINWRTKMDGKSLRDLTTMGSVPFIGSRSWDVLIEPAGALTQPDIWALNINDVGIQFPLVSYGNYYRNSTESGQSAYTMTDVEWQDIPPSTYYVNVFKACFSEALYGAIGEIFRDTDLLKLVMPYVGDRDPQWNWGFLAKASAYSGLEDYDYIHSGADDTDFTTTAPTGGSMGGWNLRTGTRQYDYSESYFISAPVEQYVVPVDGEYFFSIVIESTLYILKTLHGLFFATPPTEDYDRTGIVIVRVPDDSDELNELRFNLAEYIGDDSFNSVSDPNIIAFYDFGTGYEESPMTLNTVTTGGTYSQIATGIPGAPGAQIEGSGSVSMDISGVQLKRGDKVEVWLLTQKPDFGPVSGTIFDNVQYTFSADEQSFPEELDIASNLPDMGQVDFVKSAIEIFNLYFTSPRNSNKTVWFETRDNFFRPASSGLDWDTKGNLREGTIKPIPFYRKTTMKWGEDGEDVFSTKYGTEWSEHINDESGSHAISKEETIEITGFAPTWTRRYRFKNATQVPSRPFIDYLLIPTIAGEAALNTPQDETAWTYNYKPRLIIYSGLTDGAWKYDGNALATYPAGRFAFDENSDFCLSWKGNKPIAIGHTGILETGDVGLPVVDNKGLFGKFWAKFFYDRLFSHFVEGSLFLNETDWANVDPSTPIIMGGGAYYIYKFINGYDPASDPPNPIKVDLFRLV